MYGISVFGDSITFGRGNNLDRGWCGRLRKYFESKDYYNCLYNLGLCGDTTNKLLERFDAENVGECIVDCCTGELAEEINETEF